ncbi:MAG: YebC/PmpR family DNA-binding transcriptional regulator, partial [Firmicutes bacterium]|nr:YebC/PmpR family DNA-binding transcriptional regulator [Bacillota bacterium]
EKGLEVSEAELVQLPKTTVSVSLEDAEKVDTLMQLLDDHDDVQKVYTNAEFPEEYGEESAD